MATHGQSELLVDDQIPTMTIWTFPQAHVAVASLSLDHPSSVRPCSGKSSFLEFDPDISIVPRRSVQDVKRCEPRTAFWARYKQEIHVVCLINYKVEGAMVLNHRPAHRVEEGWRSRQLGCRHSDAMTQ